jgi:hypothetical protein
LRISQKVENFKQRDFSRVFGTRFESQTHLHTSSGWLYFVTAARLNTYLKFPPSSSKAFLMVAEKRGERREERVR